MKRFFLAALVACLPLLGQGVRTPQIYQTEWDNVLPQVADGGGWITRIWLVNMGNTEAKCNLWFYKDNGSVWNIAFKGNTQPSNVWGISIPAGGSIFLETARTDPQTTTQGWAYMETANWISGMASFVADWPGMYAEGVVPFAPDNDFDMVLPFDNRNSYTTSVALANPFPNQTATVTVQFRAPDGSVIRLGPEQNLTDTFTLAPLEHLAFELKRRYPALDDKNGVMAIRETGGKASVSALGLLFSPRNTITSIHSVSIDPHYFTQ
ncbi:MAG: hypothetical protein IT159_00325 [Bryobacterales bacterium]|nr:hypothetical protein [Bryobacterales bacterium]